MYYDFKVKIPEAKGKIYERTIKDVVYINYEYDRSSCLRIRSFLVIQKLMMESKMTSCYEEHRMAKVYIQA